MTIEKIWFGNHNDLIQHGINHTPNEWVIKFKGTMIQFVSGNQLYSNAKTAELVLRKHIYSNLLQGHYWHEKKDNTFNAEKGWMRNGGKTEGIPEYFKSLSIKLTKELLDDKIFTIEKI